MPACLLLKGRYQPFWHRKPVERAFSKWAKRVASADMRGVQLPGTKVFALKNSCGVSPWPDPILLPVEGRKKGLVPLRQQVPPATFCSKVTDQGLFNPWCYSQDTLQTKRHGGFVNIPEGRIYHACSILGPVPFLFMQQKQLNTKNAGINLLDSHLLQSMM